MEPIHFAEGCDRLAGIQQPLATSLHFIVTVRGVRRGKSQNPSY